MNKTPRFLLRDACINDSRRICELLDQQSSFVQTLDSSKKALSDFISRQDSHVIVASSEEAPCEVLGVATYIIYQRLRGGYVAIVEDVAVDISCRRKGVGSLLIMSIIERCALKGVFKVSLESSIIAEQFYIKLGFAKGGSTMKLFYD